MKQIIALLIVLILSGCDYSPPTPPERKAGTPKDAIWAGGMDGGSWILCNKDQGIKYSCAVYNDYTGELEAKGAFLHRRVTYDQVKKRQVIEALDKEKSLPSYSFYDGNFIYLAGAESLVPDGWIIWPFDKKHGKKQLYKNGEAVGEEIQY